MNTLIKLLLNGLAVFAAAYLTPYVSVDSFLTAVIVAIVLGILNTVLKPILKLLTLPITFLTLGLFSLVINLFILWLTDYLIAGFAIDGFLPLIIFSIALSVINWFINNVVE